MNAWDWVGWSAISLTGLALVAIVIGKVAADVEPICAAVRRALRRPRRWVRFKWYAMRNASALIATGHAYHALEPEHRRVLASLEASRREVGMLRRQIERMQDRERSAVTVLQLPSLADLSKKT